jgi:DNA polymerase alpha-associated DNA helicase A
MVSISENSLPASELLDKKSCLSGTVIKVTESSISVAFDTELDHVYEDLDETTSYKLIKLCNDVTHKRLKGAIQTVQDFSKLSPQASCLFGILFENTRPCEISGSMAEFEFYNDGLDESQKQAVRFSFKQKNLAIIHGECNKSFSSQF